MAGWNFTIIIKITILDNRNDESTVHSKKYAVIENEGIWENLSAQNVDDWIRFLFHEVIRMNMQESPDNFFQLGDLSFKWKLNGHVRPIPSVFVVNSFGNLLQHYKVSDMLFGEKVMLVTCVLYLE